MSYLNILEDGVLAKRQMAKSEFNYAAFNAHQAALADMAEHYREIRARKAKAAAATKRNQTRKLQREYDQLMDSWSKEKNFETFCRMEEVEEMLVKIIG